jgi:hypothetical protein
VDRDLVSEDALENEAELFELELRVNVTQTAVEDEGAPNVLKARAPTVDSNQRIYHLAQISLARGKVWKQPGTGVRTGTSWNYRLDDVDVGNANQWVYVVSETGYWAAHPVRRH